MATKDIHADLFAQLERGIAGLTSSEAWRDHLAFQSRFRRYSYGNVVLIASQNDQATHVAGFHSWRRMNRTVRRGEKAIWILAPMVRRTTAADDTEAERVVRGFKYVPVFDISQTEGADPPSVCARLCGDAPSHAYERLCAAALALGFSVQDHEFDSTTNGDCSQAERRIRIHVHNSPAQRVKTLVHELAHAILHQDIDDRSLAELEAESTAYVVCGAMGLDTSGYSFGYVATWAGGGEQAIARIKTSCDRIQKAAAAIFSLGQEADPPAPATG